MGLAPLPGLRSPTAVLQTHAAVLRTRGPAVRLTERDLPGQGPLLLCSVFRETLTQLADLGLGASVSHHTMQCGPSDLSSDHGAWSVAWLPPAAASASRIQSGSARPVGCRPEACSTSWPPLDGRAKKPVNQANLSRVVQVGDDANGPTSVGVGRPEGSATGTQSLRGDTRWSSGAT